jgi:REP element-mobilizing transposase RayT
MGRLTHRTKPGWTYFVTTKSWQSSFLFQSKEIAQIVIAKLLEYRDKENYLLHDFVLMPNHLHLILTSAADVTLEKAIQLIKGGSSHAIHAFAIETCKSGSQASTNPLLQAGRTIKQRETIYISIPS